MKIKTIRFRNKIELSGQAEREVKAAIITLALFFAGMIVGAGMMKNLNNTELLNNFSDIFNIYIQNRIELKAYKIFLNSLMFNVLFLIFTFFTGLNCLGIPIVLSIPIIKGIGYGMLSGYLLTFYKMSGIGYYLLTIYPGAMIIVVILVLACSSASNMSIDILSVTLAKRQAESKNMISYIKKFLVYLGITIAACATDAVLTKAFSYLFVF